MIPNSDTMVPNAGAIGGGGGGKIDYSPGNLLATSNMNFYVNPNNASNPGWGTGNNANNGLSIATPFQDALYAYNRAVLYNYNNLWTPSIILANGDYTAQFFNFVTPVVGSANAAGFINLQSYTAIYNLVTVPQIEIGAGVAVNGSNFTVYGGGGSGCINPLGGAFVCNGTIGFDGDGSPYPFFYDPIPGGLILAEFCTLQIATPADGNGWSAFVSIESDGNIFSMYQAHVNLPAVFDLTVAGGSFIEMGTGGTYKQQGITWTNFAGVNGRNVLARHALIQTDNGELSDIPGNIAPTLDATDVVQTPGGSTKEGTTYRTIAGPIAATDVPRSTSIFIKDTASNHQYLAVNDAGTLRLKQLDRVPNTQTASYVLALPDQDGRVEMNVAVANTVTVPPNASVPFPVGTEIKVTQIGAGATTFTPGAGVTINNNVGIPAQWATAVLYQSATNVWRQTGA